MTAALPISDAALALGIPQTELRALIAAGAPVAQRGGKGRGNCTLVDPEAVRTWRAASANERLLQTLAAELPEVLATAMAESHALATGLSKGQLAAVLAGAWYVAATRALDALRAHSSAIPDLSVVPTAVRKLREIAGR